MGTADKIYFYLYTFIDYTYLKFIKIEISRYKCIYVPNYYNSLSIKYDNSLYKIKLNYLEYIYNTGKVLLNTFLQIQNMYSLNIHISRKLKIYSKQLCYNYNYYKLN